MIRGDVYEYTLGNTRLRIVILSINAYNPRRATYATVPQDRSQRPSPALVETAAADPVRGMVDATRLRPLDIDNLGARVGRMSRATMDRVDDALRTYLGLGYGRR